LPEIADNAWHEWSKEEDVKDRRDRLDALAQPTKEQLPEEIEKVVRDVAAGARRDVREAISGYLMSRIALWGNGCECRTDVRSIPRVCDEGDFS
jgi:hypothetical protein